VFSAEFTETATYTPNGGAARGVAGIFDRVSEVSDIGEYVEADGVTATFDVATVAVPGIAYGDVIIVRGYAYLVVGIEPDGTGRTVVVLGQGVSVSFDFQWGIEDAGNNIYGYAAITAVGGPYGTMSPPNAGNVAISRFATQDTTKLVLLELGPQGASRLLGVDSVFISGLPGQIGSTELLWDGIPGGFSVVRYETIDADLSDLIVSLAGPAVSMTLTAGVVFG